MKLKLPLAHLLTRLNDTTDIHPFRPSYMQQLHILHSWSLSSIESTKKIPFEFKVNENGTERQSDRYIVSLLTSHPAGFSR